MDVVLTGRNELAKSGNFAYSKASVSSVGHVMTDAQQVNANGDAVTIDTTTRATTTITYEHHEIHAGSHYFICGFEDIDDTDSVDFAVTTPNTTKWTHMTFQVSGQSETEFYIYETSTVTGGAAVTPRNNDRNSSNTSSVTVVKNPTVNVVGTLIYSQSKGRTAATPAAASGEGVVTRDKEMILKQNTTYIFRITSRDDGNTVSHCGEWYEHTNKT